MTQHKFDEVFARLKHHQIGRPEFVDCINQLHAQIRDPQIRANLDRRRDHRSLGEFALMIYDNTRREHFLIERWVQTFAPHYRILHQGLDQSGRLVLQPPPGRSQPDYRLHGQGETLSLELKFAPSLKYLTWKVADLTAYCDYPDDLLILTLITPRLMVGSNGNQTCHWEFRLPPEIHWLTLNQDQCQQLLRRGERGHHSGFGGKATIRIYPDQFVKFFQIRVWKNTQQNVA